MNPKHPFKWRHFQSDIILLCIRWYLRYPLSYRNLEEMMLERGLDVDHTTIYRWVQDYAAELDKRCRPHLKPTNDSWRVDETYVKVKGAWKYLYPCGGQGCVAKKIWGQTICLDRIALSSHSKDFSYKFDPLSNGNMRTKAEWHAR